MFLPARPPLRRPLFPLRKRARRQSLDSGLAVLPSQAPDSPYQQRCFPERHVKARMKLCRRPSSLARLPDEGCAAPGYSEQRLMSPCGSPFYSDASEPLMTRTAAALARSLVEHYGSLTRAFRAITQDDGQMSLMNWEQELVPLQEHLEECSGRSLREIFQQIQALEGSELQISYDTWWQFFQDCLHDSHSEHLLCQDLGPREICRPVGGDEEKLTSDTSASPCQELEQLELPTKVGPSFNGGPLKSLMSRQQVETELRRRYSSSGAIGFSRIRLLPIQAPL